MSPLQTVAFFGRLLFWLVTGRLRAAYPHKHAFVDGACGLCGLRVR